jgi:phosphatidylserine decarboxylase
MMALTHRPYYDRHTGELKEDPIFARGLLHWLYNSAPGWFLNEYLFSRRWVSRFYGWLNKRRWSRRKIKSFARRLAIDLDELSRPIEAFASFNDFITREIDLAKRPIDPNPNVCIAPADGRVLAYPVIDADQRFAIKRAEFDLRALLRDDDLGRAYAGGSLFVTRLYLNDYHHFHFPADGIARAVVSIPGKYFAVTPYSEQRLVPFYGENHRMVTLLDSDHFGQVAIIEVGAFTIGSIQQRFQPDVRIRKGDHKGYFELGGSIVVLLFCKGAIQFDDDLCKNTLRGIETYIRLGDSIGRTARSVAGHPDSR